MDDLLREFLTESSESLDTVDNQLVQFEQDPNNAKILDNIFRLVHTIKGTCGFLGLPRLEALAHAGETLMGKFRDGMPVRAEAVTLILSSIDRIKEILAGLEATEAEPEGNDRDLIDQLEAMVERGMAAMAAGDAAAEEDVPVVEAPSVQADMAEGTLVSGRGLARRARARLPRDRDRSGRTCAGACREGRCRSPRRRAG
jgi:two-component system chemotaxis sensor kinase CheA